MFASSCVSNSIFSIVISEDLLNIAFDNSLINLVLPLPFPPMIQNTLLETDIGNDLSLNLTETLSFGFTSTSKTV